MVIQSGARPTGIVVKSIRSGREKTETELLSRLVTHSVF
jgi:hypothetical protein